jgi:hypothetical protein
LPTSRQAGTEDRLPAATREDHHKGRQDLPTSRQAAGDRLAAETRKADTTGHQTGSRQTGRQTERTSSQAGTRKADMTGHKTGSRQTNDKTELSRQKQR